MADVRYLARPAKAIQRKLIVDACRRLVPFGPPDAYEYVGFGALEFVDFHLMRRAVGVVGMTSIEHDHQRRQRYEFNRPYGEVSVLIGSAAERLKDIDWNGLRIVWLDYECPLTEAVLADVSQLAQRLQPGSMLIVSVNADPARPADERRATLAGNIGEARVPLRTTDASLAKWGWADTQRRVLADALTEDFSNRPDQARLHQLFDFRYADGARMQTYGGIVLIPALERTLDICRFSDLDFLREEEAPPVVIEVPDLTAKERYHLEQQLPAVAGGLPNLPGLSEADAEQFATFYRWYPSAVEAA